MPLLALNRACRRISNLFYPLGSQCASNSVFLLTTFTLIGLLWCYPVVSQYYYHRILPTTILEGQFWQFSPHIYRAPHTTDTPSCSIVFQQIRISSDNINQLYQDALPIYNSLKGDHQLTSICIKNSNGCIIHSPFEYWTNLNHFEQDTDRLKTVNSQLNAISLLTQLPMHPLSTMANVDFDSNGNLVSANSLIITILLLDTAESEDIWKKVWARAVKQTNLLSLDSNSTQCSGWYTAAKMKSFVMEYKFGIQAPSTYFWIVCFGYSCLFLILLKHFDRPQIKSNTGLAFTSIILATVCYMMTCGVYYYFCMDFPVKPAWLSLIVAVSSTLQHIFLLTNAVLSVAKDTDIRKRMGRGLQRIGVTVMVTWLGETIILLIGSTTDYVRPFCFFSGIALAISFLFCFPFFTIVLSIDIRRAELIDLSEEDIFQNKHSDGSMRLINGTERRQKTKSFLAIHSLLLCLSILFLVLTKPNLEPVITEFRTSWINMSRQFWKALNPTLENKWLKVHPVQLVLLYSDSEKATQQVEQLDSYYSYMTASITNIFQPTPKDHFFQKAIIFFLNFNLSGLLLALMLIFILAWMLPSLRENWLLPFLRWIFVKAVKIIVHGLIATAGKVPLVCKLVADLNEYTEDGIHIGAISIQSRYNKSQIDANVQNVKIKTLIGQHTADIKSIHANSNLVLSIGQDGRGVLWNTRKGELLMRLDRLKKADGSGWQAEQRKIGFAKTEKTAGTKHLLPATCGKIDLQGKYVALGYEDGVIRLWDIDTGRLVLELISSGLNEEGKKLKEKESLRQRKKNSHFTNTAATRVVHVAFLESNTKKHLVSLHRDGKLYEWDIIDGEEIQCFSSGHTREITALKVLRNTDCTFFYVIIAAKDGSAVCWKRSLNEKTSVWERLYTADHQYAITSMDCQQLQNGRGILVTGSVDGAVKVWTLDKGNLLFTLSKGSRPHLLQSNNDLERFDLDLNKNDMSPDQDVCDHKKAVCHVAITCIKNNDFKDNKCPNCNTRLNSGFFIASSGQDNAVHTWRVLYRKGLDTPGCTSCAKDYHRHQFKRRGWRQNSSNETDIPGSPSWTNPRFSRKKTSKLCEEEWDYLFLGKIPQLAGRGVLFCENMILSGIRKNKSHHQWEAWFSSLQYYEPSTLENETRLIPTITYSLEEENEQEEIVKHDVGFWDVLLLNLFGIKKVRSSKKKRPESMYFDEDEAEIDDSCEILPFAHVQFVVPKSGYSFTCDYGNFIKIISFDPIKSAD